MLLPLNLGTYLGRGGASILPPSSAQARLPREHDSYRFAGSYLAFFLFWANNQSIKPSVKKAKSSMTCPHSTYSW